MLAVGIADAGNVRVGEQEVKCDGEERQVSHQGEVLPVENHLVQPVREGQPVQSLTDAQQVGVSHTHGQIIIIQTLSKTHRWRSSCQIHLEPFLLLSLRGVSKAYLGHLFILATG